MNDSSQRSQKENDLNTLATFESEDDEFDNVHSARTAVACLPESFLDDLRRGKSDDPTTARYKVLPESDFEGDAPTLKPPPAPRSRVQELNATISAVLARAEEPTLELDVTSFCKQEPEPLREALPSLEEQPITDEQFVVAPVPFGALEIPTFEIPLARPNADRWFNIALIVVFALALLASVGTIVLALVEVRR